jgi:hypothetical protein
METEVICIYAQHTNMAGRRAWKADPTEENDDVILADLTKEEVERFERLAALSGAGSDLFYRRCASTVTDALA